MIVDFTNIIDETTAATVANGAAQTTTDPNRPTLFDPVWGYFTFGQSVNCEYGDDNWAYVDTATFTIEGSFTPDALIGDTSALTDDQIFTQMAATYMALETLFTTNANAMAPTDPSQWGTSSDPRTITLPPPLLGPGQVKIYTFPQTIRIDKTTWPSVIRYTATLREARSPVVKLIVNGSILDDAIVSYELPRPELERHQIVRCAGEVLQVKYYNSMTVGISGSMPTDAAEAMVQGLYDQQVTVQAAIRGTTTPMLVMENMNLIQDMDTETDLYHRDTRIDMRLKE